MKSLRVAALALCSVAGIGLVTSALAQNMAAKPGAPKQLTDTRTGKVWTPA